MDAVLNVDSFSVSFGIIAIQVRDDGSIWLMNAGHEDEGMQVRCEDLDELLVTYYEQNL